MVRRFRHALDHVPSAQHGDEGYKNPWAYWEHRLSGRFDLQGAGHVGLGQMHNRRLYAARVRALKRVLKRSGRVLAGQRVLEVGCGTGFYTELCRAEAVASYTGIDLTPVSVRTLTARYPGFRFIQADVSDAAFPLDDMFDIALVADVLFHIVDDNRFRTAIANISGCLAPGGHFIASDLLPPFTVQTAAHCRFRSMQEYRTQFATCGLQLQDIEPIFGVLHPPILGPHSSVRWRLCALAWRFLGLPFAQRTWFDHLVPNLLSIIDERLVLPKATGATPNIKWVIAKKVCVA